MKSSIKLRQLSNNLHIVELNDLAFYFSYETIICFAVNYKKYVCENIWSKTTGRHLDEIDGGNKAERLEYKEFDAQLEKIIKKHKL